MRCNPTFAAPCDQCGATYDEPCPYADSDLTWLDAAPIGAVCGVDTPPEECETCQ